MLKKRISDDAVTIAMLEAKLNELMSGPRIVGQSPNPGLADNQ
jgi:hypothetical protein